MTTPRPGRGARPSAVRRACAFAVAAAVAVGVTGSIVAADAPTPASPAPAVTTSVPPLRPIHPYWLELTPAQRLALAPLSDDWERLDSQTKKKWVEIALRYPTMKPDEQQHAQQRMREWAMLTPDQRRVARDSFARIRAMPPEQRAELLRKYRELPDAEKHELASQGRAAKSLVVPKVARTEMHLDARRGQLREGAATTNPALAARRAGAPVTAKAVPAGKPAAVVPNAATPAGGGVAPAPVPASPTATAPSPGPSASTVPVVAPATPAASTGAPAPAGNAGTGAAPAATAAPSTPPAVAPTSPVRSPS